MKSYRECIQLPNLRERFEYLKLGGVVAEGTFNGHRHLNQLLYRSSEWKRLRNEIIVRDNGCDLAHEDYPIGRDILVHHINPITATDIMEHRDSVFDPNNLICVSLDMHNSIHYGNLTSKFMDLIERKPNDTCPWR